MAEKKKKDQQQQAVISPPNLVVATFLVVGTSPLVIHKFSKKAQEQMMADQEAGDTKKSKNKRQPKDFEALYEAAKYVSPEGWCGIPATAFRGSLISACRIAGFVMTRAKLSLFVIADGVDKETGYPIVRITKGEPEMHVAPARNDNSSIDLRSRPMWREWQCDLMIRYDADQFTLNDVANLLRRAGEQVGICEGRNDSKKSLTGMGWGSFMIADGSAKAEAAE